MKIPMKLVYQYMVIFFNFSPTTNHIHPPQIKNCDRNLRLVVDEDDKGKFRLERVKLISTFTATGHKILIYAAKAGMNSVKTLCDSLELSHQTAVL